MSTNSFRARVLVVPDSNSAEKELHLIGVDPAGIASMTPKMLHRCIHLKALKCHQANIIKQEMLSVGGDAAVARGTVACSIATTDVVIMGTEKQLLLFCTKLLKQPFGLPKLAKEIRRVLANASLPRVWQTSSRALSLERPLIMGILNVTPDSFSDGGRYMDPLRAIDRAMQMVDEGADIIDIGGESTRPGSSGVDAEEEIRRTAPVIAALTGTLSCPISVDTWKSEVAREAMASGAEIINDISGFSFDPRMSAVAAASGAGVVLMHTRGKPGEMQNNTEYSDIIGEISSVLGASMDAALAAGIAAEKIVLDPGIGFGKSVEGNLAILRRLAEFSSLGRPLLIGTSRKSFISRCLNRSTGELSYGTAATVAVAVANGASILRVHDVKAMRDAADMAYAVNFSQ